MIKKQALKSKPICKVTFGLTKKDVPGASKVNLVGEFNNWEKTTTELTKMKSGDFKITLSLEQDKSYQFRYLVDGKDWVNDPDADRYVSSGVGSDTNCVVDL